MPKLISIIGTRPQYIKIKPFHDYCILHNINHKVIDTLQHYSDEVSGNLIDDLKLSIDYSLDIQNNTELDFISKCIQKLTCILLQENPTFVLAYGDTNTTFCASLVCYKLRIAFGHIEAGLRCNNIKVPEEVNRTFADFTSDIQFLPGPNLVNKSLNNPVICGDLEYELLNKINPTITVEDFAILTIHRQENCNSLRLNEILTFCGSLNIPIVFPLHHRMGKYLENLKIAEKISICPPLKYTEMVKKMAACKFILTDSGSIQKTSPFFGKPTLVFRAEAEWIETETRGYSRLFKGNKEDIKYLANVLHQEKKFYLNKSQLPSEIIYNKSSSYCLRD